MVAGGALAGILHLIGGGHPPAVAASTGQDAWLASAAFPGPALLASAVAVTVAASPWLSRPWRRAAWITLCAVAAARLVAGTVLPMELILALAAGVTVEAGVLVTLGVPDRRMGPDGIAAALRSAGLGTQWPAVGLYQPAASGREPGQADLGSGAAVSAVLTYRLATYWLPVAPGWFALSLLQRRDYV